MPALPLCKDTRRPHFGWLAIPAASWLPDALFLSLSPPGLCASPIQGPIQIPNSLGFVTNSEADMSNCSPWKTAVFLFNFFTLKM